MSILEVPSNLLPVRISGLPIAPPEADLTSLIAIVYNGVTYKIAAGDLVAVSGVPVTRQVIAGTGMTGGGQLVSNVTLSIAPAGVNDTLLSITGATAGTYGDATNSVRLTVNAQGRIEAISSQPIAAGGAGSVDRTLLEIKQTPNLASTVYALTTSWSGIGDPSVYLDGSLQMAADYALTINQITLSGSVDLTFYQSLIVKGAAA